MVTPLPSVNKIMGILKMDGCGSLRPISENNPFYTSFLANNMVVMFRSCVNIINSCC